MLLNTWQYKLDLTMMFSDQLLEHRISQEWHVLFLKLVKSDPPASDLLRLPPTYYVIPDESKSADGQNIHFRQTPEISVSHINIALTQQIRDEKLRNQKRILFSKALLICPRQDLIRQPSLSWHL